MRLVALFAVLAIAGCSDRKPPEPDPTPPASPDVADASGSAVADVVAANPRLTMLNRLLEASGLADALRDTAATYTLFAPSDDAFAALGDGPSAADSAAARALIEKHLLATRMLSVDVFPDLSIQTVGGTEIAFSDEGEGLAVRGPAGSGRVTDADLDADNGVVHIIDGVLAR